MEVLGTQVRPASTGVTKRWTLGVAKLSSHDGGLHGGRNYGLLQSVVELHDSASDHHNTDGSVHENVLGTAREKQSADVPGTVGWVHVLPFCYCCWVWSSDGQGRNGHPGLGCEDAAIPCL